MKPLSISPPHREKNGRRKRATRTEIAEAQKRAEQKEQDQVLSQPHRRGDGDQRLHCALGQACKRLKLREELYRAGDEYATLVRYWRVSIASIASQGHTASGIPTEPITRELADKLTARLEAADNVLKRSGAYPWVRHICVDYPVQDIRQFPPAGLPKIQQGLFDLAIHFGMLKPYDRD